MFWRDLSRWYPAQAAVRSDFVVVTALLNYALSGLWQGLKSLLVQALVTELPFEAPDVAVLHGPSWLNQDMAYAMRCCQSHEGATGELRTIVCSYSQRIPPEGRHLIQQTGYVLT
jgi:hypothetical protein